MKITNLYSILFILLTIPCCLRAMKAGLPSQEKDPQGETFSDPSLGTSSIPLEQSVLKEGKQKEESNNAPTVLPSLPNDMVTEIAQYNWAAVKKYIAAHVDIPTYDIHLSKSRIGLRSAVDKKK